MNDQLSAQVVGSAIKVDEARLLVNMYLTEYFDAQTKRAQYMHPSYAALWASIQELYQSGGKRFRPYMTLLSYGAAGGTYPIAEILPAAAAQETLHFGTLMHDDIIDRDYTRHGVDNISGQYQRRYADFFSDETEKGHFSDSAALLAGDLMMSAAFELINRIDIDANRKAMVTQTLCEAFFSVIGGELMDTESSFVDNPATPEVISTYKTASYSFVGPLVMGAQLAGADEDHLSKLSEFGTHLGIAFQLQDDLLSVFGDETVTGKSASSDLLEGKRTYLVEQFYTLASETQREQFDACFGDTHASTEDLEHMRSLLVESHAKQATLDRIHELSTLAHASLELMCIDTSHREAFQELITLCTKRAR